MSAMVLVVVVEVLVLRFDCIAPVPADWLRLRLRLLRLPAYDIPFTICSTLEQRKMA